MHMQATIVRNPNGAEANNLLPINHDHTAKQLLTL